MSFELRQFRQCPGTHAGLNVPCGSAEDWIIISLRFIQTFFLQCGPVLETLIPQGLKLFQPLGLAWAWPGLGPRVPAEVHTGADGPYSRREGVVLHR